MKEGQLLINGVWTNGQGKLLESISPVTEKALWSGHAASKSQIQDAIVAARTAFEKWRGTPFASRVEILKQVGEQLIKEKEDMASLISSEMGKPLWEARTEVSAMINKLDISIEAHQTRCSAPDGEIQGARSQTRFKPHGVIAVYGPFNLPGHLPNGHILPALLAGNTIIFKPSELTPAVGEMLIRLFFSAGCPAGVINLVQGSAETGQALAACDDIDGLFFTGSAKVGKMLHRQFAGHPEKILALELGGNNPLVVWDVKNIQAAAYTIIQSAFITSGQRCVCARRLILPDDSKGDAILNELVEMTRCLHIGPPESKPDPFIGPLVSRKSAQNTLSFWKSLIEKGGRVLLEPRELDLGPSYLTPGIVDVSNIEREDDECFGPLLQVVRVKHFQDAIREANNTIYGLSAGLLSDNQKDFEQFEQHIRAGIVNWNRQITGASSRAPFGGVGQSGNHRPSAWMAADYCSYPVASLECKNLKMPDQLAPGFNQETI